MSLSLSIGQLNLIRYSCKDAWYDAIKSGRTMSVMPAYITIYKYLPISLNI